MPEIASAASSFGDEMSDIGDLFALLTGRPAWHADALCKEYRRTNFFPATGESPRPALEVCAACLVRAECRAWALEQGPDLHGVWGGTTKKQRAKLRGAGRPGRPKKAA